MPTVSVFYGIVVRMFLKNHSPPHFHARYGEFEATIDIDQVRLLKGDLPRRALDLVLDWANQHQAELLENWTLCREKQPPRRVAPLVRVARKEEAMYWDVVEVEPEPDFCLRVTFADGLSGRVRLAPQEMTGALTPLRDADFFARVFVDQGAVAWPGEIDLAPDAMYFEIQKRQPDPVH